MENVILGFLMIKPMSGYELRKSMLNSTGVFYDSSFGTIFPTLKKLKEKNLISTDSQSNGKRTVLVHSITEKGKNMLNKWLISGDNYLKLRYEFLAKIFFSGHLDKSTIESTIINHMHELQGTLNMISELESKSHEPQDPFHVYTVEFAKDFYRFLYQWNLELKNRIK